MPTYDRYPAIDEDYNFPPPVLDALASTFGPAWATQRNVPATANLNTFTIPGVHRITTPDTQTIVNLPVGMTQAGIFENLQTGTGVTSTWWVQRISQHGTSPRMWWRSTRDLIGGWNDWEEVLTNGGAITELHVFLTAGQSGMSGRGAPSGGSRDPENPRILEYGAKWSPAPYTRTLAIAGVPLNMHDTATGLSPATTFARAYLKTQPSNVGVLIIPAAHGSTGFTTSTTTLTWTPNVATDPSLNLPALAITQTNEGVAAAKAAGYTVSIEGILWHQGENNGSLSQASYSTNLDALIAYFRTQLGNSKLPFVVGQMVPEGIEANTGRPNIDAAHQDTPNRVAYTGFAPATRGGYNTGDTTHMNRIGVEFLGRTYTNALQEARINADLKPRMGQVTATAQAAAAAYLASDPAVAQAAANMAANNTDLITKWKPNTAYVLNQQVVNPTGDVVTRTVAGTSGATYTATNWTPSSNATGLTLKADISSLRAQLISVKPETDTPGTYPLGVSIFAVGSTDAWTTSLSTITTVRNAVSRTFQIAVGKLDAAFQVRSETDVPSSDSWTAWTKLATNVLATSSINGLMLAADKAKLDAATANATASTVVYRNSGGDSFFRRATATDQPSAIDQLTRKDYVDGLIRATGLANNSKLDTDAPSTYPLGLSYFSTTDNGFPAQYATVETIRTGIASRTFQTITRSTTGERWVRAEGVSDTWGVWSKTSTDAVATGSSSGLMSSADKTKLDAASSVETATSIVMRDSSGNSQFGTVVINDAPVSVNHGTRKDYVDSQVATKAAAVHTHLLSDVTITVLGASQDLDTYQTTGLFSQSSNTNATLVLNYPEAAAGLLEVFYVATSGPFIYQRYMVYASNGADFYWRTKYAANAWTAWQRVANDSPATGSVNGLMSAADKTKLDAATALGTASTLVIRDSGGLFAITAPTAGGHPTTKTYVDTKTWDGADIATGTVLAARLPVSTGSVPGTMSAADKALLDAATSAVVVSTLVKRSGSGFIDVPTPTAVQHATRKDYVDGMVWDGTSITSGIVAAARLPVSTGSVPGTMSAADKTKLDAATSSPTNSTVAMRNSAGRIQVAEPGTDTTAATTKNYVDTQDLTLAGGGLGYNQSATLTAALNTTETMVLEISSISLVANRNYRITIGLDVQSTTAASIGVTANLRWGGTAGNPNGTLLAARTVWSPPVASAIGQWAEIVFKYTPTASTGTRFNVAVIRANGAADFKIGARDLLIEDMGAAVI